MRQKNVRLNKIFHEPIQEKIVRILANCADALVVWNEIANNSLLPGQRTLLNSIGSGITSWKPWQRSLGVWNIHNCCIGYKKLAKFSAICTKNIEVISITTISTLIPLQLGIWLPNMWEAMQHNYRNVSITKFSMWNNNYLRMQSVAMELPNEN